MWVFEGISLKIIASNGLIVIMEEIKVILFEEERKEEGGRLKILKRNMLIYVKYIYKVIFFNGISFWESEINL